MAHEYTCNPRNADIPTEILDVVGRRWTSEEDPSGCLRWTPKGRTGVAVYLTPNWEGQNGVSMQFDIEDGRPESIVLPWTYGEGFTDDDVYCAIAAKALALFRIGSGDATELDDDPRKAEKILQNDMLVALGAGEWAIEHTGGGCEAFVRYLDDDRKVYITADGGASLPKTLSEELILGIYRETDGSDLLSEERFPNFDALFSNLKGRTL